MTLDLAMDCNMAPKVQSIKEKLHQTLSKVKTFSASKDIIKKEKITYKIGEIMAYHISDISTVLFTVVQRNRTNKEQVEIDIIWIQIYEREKRKRFVMEIGSHSYEGGKFPKSAVCKLENQERSWYSSN